MPSDQELLDLYDDNDECRHGVPRGVACPDCIKEYQGEGADPGDPHADLDRLRAENADLKAKLKRVERLRERWFQIASDCPEAEEYRVFACNLDAALKEEDHERRNENPA